MNKTYMTPPGVRVYAVGDVHGYLEPLKRMHDMISMDLLESPPETVRIVYIGDYVDRGPESRQVLEYLIERKHRGDGIEKTFIEGNHERAMLEFMTPSEKPNDGAWLKWGGRETLESYDVPFESDVLLPAEIERAQQLASMAVPEEHKAFLRSLKRFDVIGDYFFAHAGVDPRKPFDQQRSSDFLVMREPFLSWKEPMQMKVVHGHTVSEAPENLHHRIGIDTGIYKGGPLTCAVLEGEDVRFLQAPH